MRMSFIHTGRKAIIQTTPTTAFKEPIYSANLHLFTDEEFGSLVRTESHTNNGGSTHSCTLSGLLVLRFTAVLTRSPEQPSEGLMAE